MKEGLDFIKRIKIPKSTIGNLYGIDFLKKSNYALPTTSVLESSYVDIYVDLIKNKFYYYTDNEIDVSENFPSYIDSLYSTELIKLKRDKKLSSLLKENLRKIN